MVNLRVEQLRRFVVLAEELNFTRAAARVHVTQQVLSSQMRRLEAAVGTPLLRRTTRHVELTPAGEAFLIRVRLAVAQVDDGLRAARETASHERLLLACEIDAQWLIADRLAAFRAAHPQVEVVPVYVLDLSALEAFTPSRVDAVVAWIEPPGSFWQDFVELAIEEACAVLPADDPLGAQAAVRPTDLGDRTLWAWQPHTGRRAWHHLVEHVHATDDHIAFVGGREGTVGPVLELMIRAVQRRGGYTFAPASFLRRSAPTGVIARSFDPPLRVPLLLAWHGTPSAGLRHLLTHVADAPASS